MTHNLLKLHLKWIPRQATPLYNTTYLKITVKRKEKDVGSWEGYGGKETGSATEKPLERCSYKADFFHYLHTPMTHLPLLTCFFLMNNFWIINK